MPAQATNFIVCKILVYKIPYRRARAWTGGCSAFRPSASREQRYLAYKQDTFARATHSAYAAGRPSAARDDRVSCIQRRIGRFGLQTQSNS